MSNTKISENYTNTENDTRLSMELIGYKDSETEDEGRKYTKRMFDIEIAKKEKEKKKRLRKERELWKTKRLSEKRLDALINLSERVNELNDININYKKNLEELDGTAHFKREEKLKPYQQELNDALNNRIYSDSDWKTYINKTGPELFDKLLSSSTFFNESIDISSGKHYQDVELIQDNHKKLRDLYTKSYINLKKSGLINGWDYKRTEVARNWKNELKYMYTVNNYFMHQLKKREGLWSWILIVISSIVSVVSILVFDDLFIKLLIQYSVTFMSVLTALIAAYIKKENYVERIKELDRYTQKVGKITTSIEYVINQKPWNRQDYDNFKERFQNEVTALLSTPPPMSPIELKNTVYDLTKTHPENLLNTYPWYKLKMYQTMPYYAMTEYGRDILESHWSDNYCRKIGIYVCCTTKLEIRARARKKETIEWFHNKNRDIELGFDEELFDRRRNFNTPTGLTNRYKVRWYSRRLIVLPLRNMKTMHINNYGTAFCVLFLLLIIYSVWLPITIIFLFIETIWMCLLPCFLPEYNQFLYPENYNLMIERKMKYKLLKEKDNLLGNIDEHRLIQERLKQKKKEIEMRNNEMQWGYGNKSIDRYKNEIENLKREKIKNERMNDMRESMFLDSQNEIKILKEKIREFDVSGNCLNSVEQRIRDEASRLELELKEMDRKEKIQKEFEKKFSKKNRLKHSQSTLGIKEDSYEDDDFDVNDSPKSNSGK